MDFVVFAASVPGPVELGTLAWVSVAALAAVLAPLWLVARQALGFGAVELDRPTLRVIEDDNEVHQRAA